MAFTDALESGSGYVFVAPTITGTLNTVFAKEVFDEFKLFNRGEKLEIYYWHLDTTMADDLKTIFDGLGFDMSIISQSEDEDAWAFVQVKDKKGIHSTGA